MSKHFRLIGLVSLLAMMIGVVAASSAFAAAPELVKENGEALPAKTPVKATGTKPKLVGASTIECATVESSKGEVEGTSGKTTSIALLYKGCEETASKAKCTTSKKEAGQIETPLLLVTLYGTAKKAYAVNASSKSLTGTLAEFTCGEKAVKVTGCVAETLTLTESNKMLEEVTIAGAEKIEFEGKTGQNCEEKAFGLKSEQEQTTSASYESSSKLLALKYNA